MDYLSREGEQTVTVKQISLSFSEIQHCLVAESERASVSHAALSLDDTTDTAWRLDNGL